MAKKKDQEKTEITYKQTLNSIDRMWIDNHPDLLPGELCKKFAECYLNERVPSVEAIRKYRARNKSASAVTTTRKDSGFTQKNGATVMNPATAEKADKITPPKVNPPWVARIFKDD